MKKAIVTIGCLSTHNGVVITGDPTASVNGKPVARIGDLHACPRFDGPHPHSIKRIIPGSACPNRPTVLGRQIALAGDLTECGAMLLPLDQTGQVDC